MDSLLLLEVTRDSSPAEIRQAYKRALLKYHPDKRAKNSSGEITIDDINTAYLRVLAINNSSDASDAEAQQDFVTYSEIVDLDDMEFDDPSESWRKQCRCGESYVVTMNDLQANGNAQEISVQCANCSLWIVVEYSAAEE